MACHSLAFSAFRPVAVARQSHSVSHS